MLRRQFASWGDDVSLLIRITEGPQQPGPEVRALLKKFKKVADFDGSMGEAEFKRTFSWKERRILGGYEGSPPTEWVVGGGGGPLARKVYRLSEARSPSKAQISHAQRLLKQLKVKSPTAAEVADMDDIAVSKLISKLSKQRGEAQWYKGGGFGGWKKEAMAEAVAKVVHYRLPTKQEMADFRKWVKTAVDPEISKSGGPGGKPDRPSVKLHKWSGGAMEIGRYTPFTPEEGARIVRELKRRGYIDRFDPNGFDAYLRKPYHTSGFSAVIPLKKATEDDELHEEHVNNALRAVLKRHLGREGDQWQADMRKDSFKIVFADEQGRKPGRGMGRFSTIPRLIRAGIVSKGLVPVFKAIDAKLKEPLSARGTRKVSLRWRGPKDDEEWSVQLSDEYPKPLDEYGGVGGRVAGARHPFRIPLSNVHQGKPGMAAKHAKKIKEIEQRRQDVRERLRAITLGEGRRPLKTIKQ